MRFIRFIALALVVALAPSASAEIIERSFGAGGAAVSAYHFGSFSVQHTGPAQAGNIGGTVARVGGAQGRIDTTAETGQFFGSAVLSPGGMRTITQSFRLAVGEPTFPNPAPTALWRVTVQHGWSVPTSMPILSSTTAPLVRFDFQGSKFTFRPAIEIGIPETLTLMGSYRIEGPSTTIGPISFSHTYRPTGALQAGLATVGNIFPGSNFPATSSFTMGYDDVFLSSYEPESPVAYTHTVDGAAFRLNLFGSPVWLNRVPEPATWTLLAVGVVFAPRRLIARRATREVTTLGDKW